MNENLYNIKDMAMLHIASDLPYILKDSAIYPQAIIDSLTACDLLGSYIIIDMMTYEVNHAIAKYYKVNPCQVDEDIIDLIYEMCIDDTIDIIKNILKDIRG